MKAIGLAPAFILAPLARGRSPWSFHLSFWCGMLCVFSYAFGRLPSFMAIGEGKNALLLGVNLYGLLLCSGLSLLLLALGRVFKPRVSPEVASRA